MTLTLLALFVIPLYLKLVLDPAGAEKHFKNTGKDPALQLLHSALMLLLATWIFASSGFNFTDGWNSVLPWLGAFVYIKGAFFLIAPKTFTFWVNVFNQKTLPAYGFFGLLMALLLIYIDTQLI